MNGQTEIHVGPRHPSSRRSPAIEDAAVVANAIAGRRKSTKRTNSTLKKKSQAAKLVATEKRTLKRTKAKAIQAEAVPIALACDPEQTCLTEEITPNLQDDALTLETPVTNEWDSDAHITEMHCDSTRANEDSCAPISVTPVVPDSQEVQLQPELTPESANAESIDSRPRPWEPLLHTLMQAWKWIQRKVTSQRTKKRLRVCESVSLGEKRFIAVIQVDGEQFLVGGSSSSVSTLARLERCQEFADVYRVCEQDLSRA